MIVDLVNEGWRVGVTANSHKVIGELLAKVAEAADERGVRVRIGQRSNDEPTFSGAVHMENNDAARDSLAAGSVDVLGGTTWLWSREDMTGSVDILFIDEAGQMSLADAVAASLCTGNLVLLGDPQQLDQPLQGTHPPGAERSVLAHVLHGERVIPDQFGLFLEGSWEASSTHQFLHVGDLLRRTPSLVPPGGSRSTSPACLRCPERESDFFPCLTAAGQANLLKRPARWHSWSETCCAPIPLTGTQRALPIRWRRAMCCSSRPTTPR